VGDGSVDHKRHKCFKILLNPDYPAIRCCSETEQFRAIIKRNNSAIINAYIYIVLYLICYIFIYILIYKYIVLFHILLVENGLQYYNILICDNNIFATLWCDTTLCGQQCLTIFI
jgi:hypothetical protein